jgi:hypothetical protein
LAAFATTPPIFSVCCPRVSAGAYSRFAFADPEWPGVPLDHRSERPGEEGTNGAISPARFEDGSQSLGGLQQIAVDVDHSAVLSVTVAVRM